MAQFQIGSISTGTLRPEDLLPAFARVLQDHNGAGDIHDICLTLDNPLHALFGEYMDIEITNTWDSEDASSLLNEGFYYALNDICPPFVYFGTLPGDGADFGFWVDWEGLEEARRDGDGMTYANGEEYLVDANVIVHVNDHGNVTVMDMERNVLWDCV